MTPSRRTLSALTLALVLAAVTAPSAGAGAPGGGAVAPTGATGASSAGATGGSKTTSTTTTTRTTTSRTQTTKAKSKPKAASKPEVEAAWTQLSGAARADPPLGTLLQGSHDRVLEQPAQGAGDRRARSARPLPHTGLLGVLPAGRREERARDSARRSRSPDSARPRRDDPDGGWPGRIVIAASARALEALRADHRPRAAGARGPADAARLDDLGHVGVRLPRMWIWYPNGLQRRQPRGASPRRRRRPASRRSTSRAPTAARTSGRSSLLRSSPRCTRLVCRSAPGSTSTATTRWARRISGSRPPTMAPTAS